MGFGLAKLFNHKKTTGFWLVYGTLEARNVEHDSPPTKESRTNRPPPFEVYFHEVIVRRF